ncbi:MAG: YerC/YecD family TrpR-related protein [Patescibacteria group bacterium]
MKELKLDSLFEAILTLKNVDECEKFFRDLCTISELKCMSERWDALKMIEEGIPYRTIAKKTGTSTATVTRIAHWLNNGTGGYKMALGRRKV